MCSWAANRATSESERRPQVALAGQEIGGMLPVDDVHLLLDEVGNSISIAGLQYDCALAAFAPEPLPRGIHMTPIA